MSRIFGSWTPPETVLTPDVRALPAEPRDAPSETCGGTGGVLDIERKKATFDPFKLTLALDGSAKGVSHRRWLWAAGEIFDNSGNYFRTREETVARHVETFIGIHKKFADDGYRPEPDDVMMMSNASKNQGAFGLHFGAFATTLASQGTMDQVIEWVPRAYTMQITGCLAQTELMHGSNVRGLQSVAVYDPATQEFVINTPTLGSIKWWPGGMGKMAIFSCFYANLITQGVERGFHVFIVQLRDENHKPMPGVEVFEVGPKIGDNGTETGGLRLTNVRIPREWLLMKNQVVHPDGTYEKSKKNGDSKIQYSTMLTIRTGLVMGAGYRLAQGVTIASRYSCVRRQGFEDTSATSRDAPELQIIEYQNQQYRLFKQLGLAYAMVWTGKVVSQRFKKVLEALQGEDSDSSELPEMHAVSSGLKALCTFEGAQGLEECRKLLGGHGVLLAAGIGQLALDYTTYVTAEGDRIVLELQSARYLIKQLNNAREGKKISGLCEYLTPCKDRGYDPAVELRTSASTVEAFKDLALLEKLLRGRALNHVVAAGDRLEEEVRRHNGNFDKAWNACAIDLVQSSRVHCYYMMLVNFAAACASGSLIQDDAAREAMTNVCRLFALQLIAEDFGSFDLTRAQQRVCKDAIRTLLPVIRNDAIALTDAFEFPDNVLNSACGRYDGKVFESLYEAAKLSPLNRSDPFLGYNEHLKPILDLDFVKEKAQQQRVGALAGGAKL